MSQNVITNWFSLQWASDLIFVVIFLLDKQISNLILIWEPETVARPALSQNKKKFFLRALLPGFCWEKRLFNALYLVLSKITLILVVLPNDMLTPVRVEVEMGEKVVSDYFPLHPKLMHYCTTPFHSCLIS